ncbi:MAG: AraC family transcriptional regulator, partial [Cellvibrio sp.]
HVFRSPKVTDPLTEIVMLLQPQARFSKVVSGAGAWRIYRPESGQPFYCVILKGFCHIEVNGQDKIDLKKDDFVLIPSVCGFAMSSLDSPSTLPETTPVAVGNGEFRLGVQDGSADVSYLVGHCAFGSLDSTLLVSLLPQVVHIRDQHRLGTLVQLVRDESCEKRPGREAILSRLLEVLFIEALRFSDSDLNGSGLIRGLADERIGAAIRKMHENINHSCTVATLAKEAALSRSAFFERFSRTVGIAPMEYLLTWRMALAKNLLRQTKKGISEIAEHVGYASASAFSVAFTRHVGQSPSSYARG